MGHTMPTHHRSVNLHLDFNQQVQLKECESGGSRFAPNGHKMPSMLLTITMTHGPATDLGYLLHKNPARPQKFELAFGSAHVFYTNAQEHRCTAALLLD